MPAERDVAAFAERAARYEDGWLGRLHREIVDRTVAVAFSLQSCPRRLLDVGCGTGYLLRVVAAGCPAAVELAGVDPAAPMVDVAIASTADPRVSVAVGSAEHLPYSDAVFDLVVSTTSFDHWVDQRAGIAECARVLTPAGRLVVSDLFSPWLMPTLLGSRRDKARTKARANRLLSSAGFHVVSWHDVYPLVKAVVAVR